LGSNMGMWRLRKKQECRKVLKRKDSDPEGLAVTVRLEQEQGLLEERKKERGRTSDRGGKPVGAGIGEKKTRRGVSDSALPLKGVKIRSKNVYRGQQIGSIRSGKRGQGGAYSIILCIKEETTRCN